MSEHLQMQVHVCVQPCLLRSKVHIKLTITEANIVSVFLSVFSVTGGRRGLVLTVPNEDSELKIL